MNRGKGVAATGQRGVIWAQDGGYGNHTVEGNLAFICRLRGLPKVRVREMLAELQLGDEANSTVKDLPSGLRRRLAFGAARLHRPRALILARDDRYMEELCG